MNILSDVSMLRIMQIFHQKYDSAYSQSSSKLHLDFEPTVIDGPRERWRSIALLDAILCLLSPNPNEYESKKRKFNQCSVLREAVVIACGEALAR